MASKQKMNLNFSSDWLSRMADLERDIDLDFGAGLHQLSSIADSVDSRQSAGAKPSPTLSAPSANASAPLNVAFSRFVQLMRRERGLTVEDLADSSGIEIGELVEIEDDLHHQPEPRSVHLLAQFFNLPAQNLYAIAGLTGGMNDQLREESVRFAARSNPAQTLSPSERTALEAFVAVLSEKK